MPHRRLFLVSAVAIALVFAGCLTNPDEASDTEPGTNPDGSTGSSDPGGAPPAADPTPNPTQEPNHPPTASLSVSNTSGRVPFTVTFTIDGDDPNEGDAIAWFLDVDGDGTHERTDGMALTEVEWTYETAGNFTAILRVSDGELEANDTLLIQVAEAAAVAVPEPIVFEGTITGAWAADAGYVPGPNNHTFDLKVPVGNITVNITFGETAFDLDFALVAPTGEVVASAANFNEPTGNVFDTSEPNISTHDPTYTHMLGTWTVSVYPGMAVNGGYTVAVTFA